MNKDAKICVFLPAYNEEKTVAGVVQNVKQNIPNCDVVVINDGSVDKTREEAIRAGAVVLDLPFNLGIGGAVQTGLKFAQRGGYDVAVEIDADGQHDPFSIKLLIESLLDEEEKADMVIGSRFIADTSYRSSKMRRFGIHLFSWLIKLVTKKRIYDSTSGFRAYNKRAIALLSKKYPSDFPEPESIVMLLNNGFKIREVPVKMHLRSAGESAIGGDFSYRALYFVVSNSIAILISGLKEKKKYAQ